MIQVKRAYDPPEKKDGYRVLVDRLWPRGIKKEELDCDEWAKELAPSTELRRAFGHDPKKWRMFQTKYRVELRAKPAAEKLQEIAKLARKKNVTLIYAAKDEEHNNAVVLREEIEALIPSAKAS